MTGLLRAANNDEVLVRDADGYSDDRESVSPRHFVIARSRRRRGNPVGNGIASPNLQWRGDVSIVRESIIAELAPDFFRIVRVAR